MELIERYVQDIVRRLPRGEREDVARELRTALTDGLERLHAAGVDREQAALTLLREWPRPAEQARSYRTGPDHLIGPRYIDSFWKAARTGILIVALLAAIGPVLTLADGSADIKDVLVALSDWWNGLLQWGLAVVGGCALVLAIAERSGTGTGRGEAETAWDPGELPDRKDPDRLDRSGAIIELILLGALLLLMNWRPTTLGIPVSVDGVRLSLPLTWPELGANQILLNALLIGGMAMLLTVLMRGRWNLFTRFWSLGLSGLQIWLFARLRTDPELFALDESRLVAGDWPPDLAADFVDVIGPILDQVQDKGFALVIVITVVEVVVKVVKLVRRQSGAV